MTFDAATLNQLFRYCLALSNDSADAQDLLQSAIEAYLRRPGSVSQPVAYIRQSARNRFYDQWRRHQRLRFESLVNPDLVAGVEQDLERAMIDQQAVAAINDLLSPQERECVFLWAVEGLTATEIAEQLGEPRGTILSRLHRLKQRLQRSGFWFAEGQHYG